MNIRSLIKPLFKIESHMDLVPQTAVILKNDGKEELYARLQQRGRTGKTGLELLAKGAADADKPFSGGFIVPLWHFHHPWSHRGYLVGSSSADQAAWLFNFALGLWQKKREEQALYHLGRALHLIQDIFIPQHAAVTALKGHGELENWLSENWEAYRVERGGFYRWECSFHNLQGDHHTVSSERPYDWIDHGSHLSSQWFDRFFGGGHYDEASFHRAAALTIPHALRFSAGFLNKFFLDAGL
ncbi:MAG: hypothetical protein GX044_10350 [Firmicutes bacterium]|jgi:hypothetical protein|nr:hypothetical protein [Bacillota bacterium]